MKLTAIWVVLLAVLPGPAGAQVAAHDYTAIYEQASPAIVTIITEAGRGSGFLVTPFGHIATNFHVVRNAKYLAVQFTDGRKVAAEIVATHESRDMALIKVNSEVTQGIRPLDIAPAEKDSTIKVGLPVVAIGSPHVQDFVMTQGILSKASDMTLLGDFVLQPGSSGGPLLNLDGEVVGMNTFIEGTIAGAIRIDPLRDIVHSSYILESALIEPSPAPLPTVRPERYPVDILNEKVATEPLAWDAYRFEAGDFEVTAITPVLIGQIQVLQDRMRAANRFIRRSKDIKEPGIHNLEDPFYSWQESTGDALSFAVRFDIQPRAGLTTGSKWSRAFSYIFTLGKAGTPDMEFKGEFLEFRVFRDGRLIEPITPGRHLIAGSAEKKRFLDQAYGGVYVYEPSEFLIGDEFRIEIVDARKPNEPHKTLVFKADSPLIRQIRSDFTYRPPAHFVGGQAHIP